MSDTSAEGKGTADHQEMIDALLFKRNLDEVFLLLDFISGRPDKELSKLVVPDLAGGVDLTARQVVAKLAGIRYPYPSAEPPSKKSDDAAFLLLAKDRLANLAYPARGSTIAYTALFSRTETEGGISSFWSRFMRWTTPHRSRPEPDGSRKSLAESAFPGLAQQVRCFNRAYILLICLTLLWLVWSAFAYWDVAMGRSILQRIDQIHTDRSLLYLAAADLAIPNTCATPSPQQAVGCNRLTDLGNAEMQAQKDLINFRSCTGWWCGLLHVERWGFVLCGVHEGTMTDENSIPSLISVYNNYVLPMMFGVLGTFVAALRMVQTNVRDSTLSPRNFGAALMSLPLGIVAGVAVGLFYSPMGAPSTGSGTAGVVNLTMTASGLGFLAGYGSQTFFEMLDALLKKTFALTADPGQSKPPI